MLNLSPEDYADIELGQFFNKLNGFYEFQHENEKREWERIQYVSYSIMVNNPNIKRSDKPKTFQDFLEGKKAKPTQIKSAKQLKQFLDF